VTSFLDQPVGQFLDQLAARTPTPGGGGAAALAAALAAGLAGMAARFSATRLPGAEEMAGHADDLRRRASALADADAEAYGAVLAAFALPRDPGNDRDQRIRDALGRAAELPAEMAEIAAQVAGMAARLATEGNPNLCGDSVTAAVLAEAAARSSAVLVDINVTLGGLDPAVSQRAARAVSAAHQAAHSCVLAASSATGQAAG
jgi:formiminotetrahydrofolate cyclodeaminase